MPTRSTFNHYNLTKHNASKKTFNVSKFYGVEYRRSQLETQDHHATDIKNIVYKDKTNQKRSGYEQVAKAPYNVNGYYEFYDERGYFHKIMHIKDALYEVSNLGKDSYFWNTELTQITGTIADHKSMAFASKGILYILDGLSYKYLRYTYSGNTVSSITLANVVGSNLVYIPTTSNLSPDGSVNSFEDVNILTNLRKNTIEGAKNKFIAPIITEIDNGTVFVKNNNSYSVDLYYSTDLNGTKVRVVEDNENISISGFGYNGCSVQTNYYLWFKHDSSYSEATQIIEKNISSGERDEWILDAGLTWIETYTDALYFKNHAYLVINGVTYTPWYFIQPDETRFIANAFNFSPSNDTSTVVADLSLTRTQAILHIYNTNILKENENENTIHIVFPSEKELDTSSIDNCTFGIVYSDRLFISGNSSYKNTDWHTQPITNYGDSNTYGEFTYFSDLDYCNYGSDNTSVVGYDIFSDGNLIVFKEPSRFEPTIYRRYKELKVATSYTGEEVTGQNGKTLYEEGYPCFPINTMGGEGAISNRSIVNFLGDTLVLTKNGLKKLYTRQNTYNAERIFVDVSSNINLAILEENLNNAFIFTFKDRLIMKVGDYVYLAYDSLKENNEYEWYKLEGIKADIFFEIDDELYFADIDGNICKFNEGEYYFKDRDRVYTNKGAVTQDLYNGEITLSATYGDKIKNGDKVTVIEYWDTSVEDPRDLSTFTTYRPMYYCLGAISSEYDVNNIGYIEIGEDGKTKLITIDESVALENNLEVYLDGEDIANVYTLEKISDVYPTSYYLKQDGSYADFSDFIDDETTITSNVWVSSKDKELKVADYDSTTNTFVLKNELDENVIFLQRTYAESYSCIITQERNVEAYYITRPYDMGSIGYDKTIWQYTIANDTNLESVTDLGYLANRKQGIAAFAKGNKGLRFDEYNFGTISFLNDGLPHIYTKYRVIPSVNFIRFTFRNLEETNMALSQLSFVYSVSGQVRGSK